MPNPTWNESFKFPIENGSEDLQITLFDDATNNEPLGVAQIQLQSLRDQIIHSENIELLLDSINQQKLFMAQIGI